MVTKSLVQVKEMRKVSDVEILRAFECLIVKVNSLIFISVIDNWYYYKIVNLSFFE